MSNSILKQTSNVIGNYVSRNHLPAAELPDAIKRVYTALVNLHAGADFKIQDINMPTNAEISASLRRDRLTSFIDGKSYKMLKRHLTKHGLTPQQYRQRYGLPADYPVVAPAYAAVRSRIAKQGYPKRKAA